MPARLVKPVESDREAGAGWLWSELNFGHPIFAGFRQWLDEPNYDFVRHPPVAHLSWTVEPAERASVLAAYSDDPKKPRPALVERDAGKGRVLLFTTPLDGRRDPDTGLPANDYLTTSFYLVLATRAAEYIAGVDQPLDANVNAGAPVQLRWPPSPPGKQLVYYLSGPGVTGADAVIRRPPGENLLRVGGETTGTAGNFTVTAENRAWSDGYSVNAPAAESDLSRVPVEQVEAVLGPGTVAPADKAADWSAAFAGTFGRPVELFPLLLVLLLLAFSAEGVLANRFYGRGE
jgi:hypothetical protein